MSNVHKVIPFVITPEDLKLMAYCYSLAMDDKVVKFSIAAFRDLGGGIYYWKWSVSWWLRDEYNCVTYQQVFDTMEELSNYVTATLRNPKSAKIWQTIDPLSKYITWEYLKVEQNKKLNEPESSIEDLI